MAWSIRTADLVLAVGNERLPVVWCVQRFFTFGDLREDSLDRGAPDEDSRLLVMSADVITDGSGQFPHVVERPSAQALLRGVAEPSFDQVKPGTGCGREVKVEARVATQPTLDTGMLVSGIVVHDQMQVPSVGRLLVDVLQETNAFLMPVPWHAIAIDGAVERIQTREQRGGSVARVIMGHPGAATGAQRQTRLGSVARLNLALFIHAQDQRLVRRVQVKADDIREFFREARITAHLEGRDAVGPQPVLLPNVPHGRFADPLSLGHRPGAPMRGIRRPAVQGGFYNRRAVRITDGRNAAGTRGILLQTGGPQGEKSISPQLHRGPRNACLLRDPLALATLSRQQHDPRPLNKTLRSAPGSGPTLQSDSLLIGKKNGSALQLMHGTLIESR